MTFFRDRIDALPLTLEFARKQDVSALATAITRSGEIPVITIGSGGSLITAGVLARQIERQNRVVARTMTPLEFIADPVIAHRCCVWLVSAEGTNPDILAALEAVLRAEPAYLNVICNRRDAPLVTAAQAGRGRVFLYPTDNQKDGFLATHSLMLSCALAFNATGGHEQSIPITPPAALALIEQDARPTFEQETIFVLFDPLLLDAAKLVETNFWEAALANVAAVDLRNFAHGRHLWAARQGRSLGLLVFLTDRTRSLWEELDRELPADIPRTVVELDSRDPALVMNGLWCAMIATDEAGQAQGVDPGRPGVQEFGRRIYHSRALLTAADAAPRMSPKNRKRLSDGFARKDDASWNEAEWQFRARISARRFSSLVLDYDGTVVWSDARRERPDNDLIASLSRLLLNGVPIGIATGRGDSVGAMLRQCLDQPLWERVLVGYYNGGLCLGLDQDIEGRRPEMDATLEALAAVVDSGCYANSFAMRKQGVQLCLTSDDASIEGLHRMILQILAEQGLAGLTVVRSGHSVDVLSVKADKRNVVDALSVRFGLGGSPCLRIGDSGAFPGNDFSLLASADGLSVDGVSDDPDCCWNLLPAGIRGPEGLGFYLDRLVLDGDGFSIGAMTL